MWRMVAAVGEAKVLESVEGAVHMYGEEQRREGEQGEQRPGALGWSCSWK